MPIFRKNLITNDWVMFSPERKSRPSDYKKPTEDDRVEAFLKRPEKDDKCPFCIGNEKKDDKEILRYVPEGREKDDWQVRILANKYASLDRTKTPNKNFSLLCKEMDGFGIHDVIIDHPHHNKALANMSLEDATSLMEAYKLRYIQVCDDPNVNHVVIFKNQGYKAGGSLQHPHSQIYGLPLMPFETKVRLGQMENYHVIHDHCLMCDILKMELKEKKRIVYENDSFVAIVPFASLSPYHTWIVPRKHQASFRECVDLEDLADIMTNVCHMSFHALENPDYNFILQSLSHYERESEYFHWYFSVIYHTVRRGGIEFAGGLFNNPIMPEEAAEHLLKHKKKG